MVHLKDYTAPDFWIRETKLNFDLFEDHARVRSNLKFERRAGVKAPVIVLDGENLQFKGVKLDGVACAKAAEGAAPTQGEYAFDREKLLVGVGALSNPVLEIEVVNEPQKNLSCEGLYRSSGMFCTQCEAESFRRITYYLDRPDVMSIFTVTLTAEKAKYPILLSNGNRTNHRELEGGRHEATWFDPHKKPCYLFALVAGDLGVLRSSFITASGRTVALKIYSRKGLEKRCEHAMDSLKKSMKWDEERFGLEYDLDVFMIVVADDFNMGAMENKGLNIFNAHYVLAEPATATDHDFNNIQAVVGHEYFHNWTGNRITCRDWFQLSLKEGLTVYRDQEFSADMGSRAVKRIQDVIRLRTHQFAEDSGPMAHPVRPQSYVAIDNFYTLTVYEKGAELIRMIETLIGREAFRKGSDKYFELFDGQAVTTDDFVQAMALGAKEVGQQRDFTQFKNWYDQAGTPTVKVETRYLADEKKFEIKMTQSCAPSPGQAEKKPYLIPVAIGLLGRDAKTGGGRDLIPTRVLELSKPEQTFVIDAIEEKPVLSLLRGFSAPVKAECEFSVDELSFLIAHDSDPVARWEATQQLMLRVLKAKVAVGDEVRPADAATTLAQANSLEASLIEALRPLLTAAETAAAGVDPAFVSFMLQLPSENYIAQFFTEVDVDAIFNAHNGLLKAIAQAHRQSFEKIYERLSVKPIVGISSLAQGERALRNSALTYLCMSDDLRDLDRALRQRRDAKDMTTELGALEALNRSTQPARLTGLDEFRAKWKDETLVMNKWLTLRAVAPGQKTLTEVKKLMDDSVFDKNNPNKIYSLMLAFAKFNSVGFHARSGDGYKFIADQVLDVDRRNPQVASRLVSAFNQWKTFDPDRRALIQAQLSRISKHEGLSTNVSEIVGRALT
ncbi:aminopeptidase N [soil metagenome]